MANNSKIQKAQPQAKAVPQIGDAMPDGGIYVGKSATTGKDLHAASSDEPKYLTFDEAYAAAEKMKALPGRENAHVPTPEELDINLFRNRSAGKLSGTFNTSGSCPASCYRSSASYNKNLARVRFLDDGCLHTIGKNVPLPVRLVW
jgi:hypothetical protein